MAEVNRGELGANIQQLGHVELPSFGQVQVIQATKEVGCVDPRQNMGGYRFLSDYSNVYKPTSEANQVRSVGGHMGDVLIALAVAEEVSYYLDPNQAVELVFSLAERQGVRPSWHEDEHAYTHSPKKSGCGYLDRASQPENDGLFGVSSAKVREALAYANGIAKAGERPVNVPILEHDHIEIAAVVVYTEITPQNPFGFTVNPVSQEGNEAFRWDRARHFARLRELAYAAQVQGIPLSVERMEQMADRHTMSTLSLLKPGIPVHEVSLNGINAQTRTVRFAGNVPNLGNIQTLGH
ncbi:MAG: hypothetical protein HY431_00405 [Candidatus Levybacteria bacterium]|nr:hypothetical protein [Candidatus Levybacteria bacterium]